MLVINSPSEIETYVDSETASKYAIVVMLDNCGKLEPGILTTYDNGIRFKGTYLYARIFTRSSEWWLWPPRPFNPAVDIIRLMHHIMEHHSRGDWSTKFYILQNPTEVSWFIHEFNIPSVFSDLLTACFITEKNCNCHDLRNSRCRYHDCII